MGDGYGALDNGGSHLHGDGEAALVVTSYGALLDNGADGSHLHGEAAALVVTSPGGSAYRVYPQRWRMIVIFGALCGTNGFVFMAPGAVATPAIAYYRGLSSTIFDVAPALFFIFFIPLAPLLGVVLARRGGLRRALLIAAVSLGVGGSIPLLARAPTRGGFAWWLAGSAVCSVSTPFLLGATTQVAQAWFPDTERSTAVGVAVLLSQLGLGFGYLLPALIVPSSDEAGEHRDDRHKFLTLHAVQAAIVLVVLAATSALFRSRPPSPPSFAAARAAAAHERRLEQRESEGEGEGAAAGAAAAASPRHRRLRKRYADAWGTLHLRRMSGRAFWSLACVYGFVVSMYWSLGILLDQVLVDSGYGAGANLLPGSLLNFLGCPGIWLSGVLLDRRIARANTLINACNAALVACLALLGYLLGFKDEDAAAAAAAGTWTRAHAGAVAACAVAGLAFSVLQPAALELAADTTYPVPAAASNQVLTILTQVSGVLYIFAPDALHRASATGSFVGAFWLFTGCVASVGLAFFFFAPTRLKRSEAEEAAARRLSGGEEEGRR